MNRQIEELWEKAAQSTAAYPSGRNNSWETQVNFMEKFAELIVRECMSLVSEPGPDMNDTERGILAQIKKHFGVEE